MEETKEEKPSKKFRKRQADLLKEFKEFISKGNIMQLAIAFVMGVAFTAIINSLVGDIIMPFFTFLFGTGTASIGSLTIPGTTIHYGNFIMAVINFILIALVLFFIMKLITGAGKGMKKLKKGQPLPPPPPAPEEKIEAILKDIRTLLKDQAKDKTGKTAE